jgi:hypothetical protein
MRVGIVVQTGRLFRVVTGKDHDQGAQHHTDEASGAAGVFLQDGLGLVPIAENGDSGRGAEMKVPKLVAGGDRGDEQVLRVPACRIAAKRGVGGAGNRRLGAGGDDVVAAVAGVRWWCRDRDCRSIPPSHDRYAVWWA